MFYGPGTRPVVLPPRIHPTKHNVVYNCCEYIVPEVHPTHTTVMNKHLYKHYHNFPQTVSQVDQVANQQFMCPPGPVMPVAGPGPGVAGPGFGAPGAGFGAAGAGVAPRRRFF